MLSWKEVVIIMVNLILFCLSVVLTTNNFIIIIIIIILIYIGDSGITSLISEGNIFICSCSAQLISYQAGNTIY